MAHSNYKEIQTHLKYKQEFTHGSCGAEYENGTYRVYSYNTLIAVFKDSKCTYFNEDKFSMTTSRLQNMIRKVL